MYYLLKQLQDDTYTASFISGAGLDTKNDLSLLILFSSKSRNRLYEELGEESHKIEKNYESFKKHWRFSNPNSLAEVFHTSTSSILEFLQKNKKHLEGSDFQGGFVLTKERTIERVIHPEGKENRELENVAITVAFVPTQYETRSHFDMCLETLETSSAYCTVNWVERSDSFTNIEQKKKQLEEDLFILKACYRAVEWSKGTYRPFLTEGIRKGSSYNSKILVEDDGQKLRVGNALKVEIMENLRVETNGTQDVAALQEEKWNSLSCQEVLEEIIQYLQTLYTKLKDKEKFLSEDSSAGIKEMETLQEEV
jgi:hypothetical protein